MRESYSAGKSDMMWSLEQGARLKSQSSSRARLQSDPGVLEEAKVYSLLRYWNEIQ